MTKEETLEHYDINGDGEITNDEITKMDRMDTLLNVDQKTDAQKRMAWFALAGMLLYPLCVILSVVFGVPAAANILGSMASTYFGSVALIVSAFFGAEAYKANRL